MSGLSSTYADDHTSSTNVNIFTRCTPVWSSKVLYPMHTGMSTIHILILYDLQLHTCKDTYSLNLQIDPVQVHSHTKYPGRKVNPLWQIGGWSSLPSVMTLYTFAKYCKRTVTSIHTFGITLFLQTTKQCLTCRVNELHSTGNVSRNLTWWIWMTEWIPCKCKQIHVNSFQDLGFLEWWGCNAN